MKDIPELDSTVLQAVTQLAEEPKIRAALSRIKTQTEFAMQEQIELCEIEAPTFHEDKRADSLADRMKKYGLPDVRRDAAGNVIGIRKGTGKGPVLVIAAHMDSVFPAGTDVKVRQEGNIYRAPGIGDNCSGLRALLQVLRALEEEHIETAGDIWFVGTVGEEGNGDIRGSKHLCANNRIDGFIAVDSTDVGRVLYGAVGSHRWRISADGHGGHSFADFGKTPSAIHAVCRAGSRIADISVPEDPKTTFTIGTIKGGTTVNSISAHCEVEVDIRSVSNEELLRVESEVLSAFEKAVEAENAHWNTPPDKALRLTKTMIGNRPGGLRPHGCPVLQAARSAQKVLGIALTNYTMTSTDANAPMSLNIPSTCLCSGGKGIGAHTLKEYFVKESTELGPQLVLLTALALAGTSGSVPLLPKGE
jgi:acetylornithine deacetylase/succinyl-diaminopimelate desuccinylase-like protein